MMKILELFCGMGGWSVPFIEDGDEVIGIDIVDNGYPKGGQLILQDIRTVDGARFKGFDLVIGSPPCTEFSDFTILREFKYGVKRNPEKGLELIREFHRIVKEAEPKYFAFENVWALTKYYSERPPIWRFKISRGGKRGLWGNIPIPFTNEITFKSKTREKRGAFRSLIPYPIARLVADCVKSSLTE